jgi:hypothetical protein
LKALLAAATLLALLPGCRDFPSLRALPKDPGLFLLKPADAGFEATLNQSITISHGENSVELQAVVEVSKDSVTMVALGPFGNRVLSIVYDGRDIQEWRDPSLPQELPSKLILRDLQLAYWSPAAVSDALPKGWSLKVMPKRRSVSYEDMPMIGIDFKGDHFKDRLVFTHRGLGYKLVIEALDDSND